MIKSGLVSVTFRKLEPKEIINIAKRAGLSAIEWGGDVHVPHGDVKTAKEVRKMTLDAGLEISSYGSYYRCGKTGNINAPVFHNVLKSAIMLQVDTIRVWAGEKASSVVDLDYIRLVTEDSRRIAEMAIAEGIKVAFEYHTNTLTDSIISTDYLIKDIKHLNIYSYWQPPSHYEQEMMKSSLESILPYLSNIHVNHCFSGKRFALSGAAEIWDSYLDVICKAKGDRYALLEFVKDDSPEQLIEDAETLIRLLNLKNQTTVF